MFEMVEMEARLRRKTLFIFLQSSRILYRVIIPVGKRNGLLKNSPPRIGSIGYDYQQPLDLTKRPLVPVKRTENKINEREIWEVL